MALSAPLVATALLAAGCGSGNDPAPVAASRPASPAAGTDSAGLKVTTTDFAFAPTTLTAKAGKVRVTLVNRGSAVHELVVLRTAQAAGALKVSGGRVSEAHAVGEVSETAAGATKSATLNLKAGRYVFVCNIPGHYQDGMRGTLTVK
jgi:uncharacterized cupredoxin-like copper-binding protein